MKNHIENSKGSIIISCFVIGMLVIMLGMSSITLSMNDFRKTLSNSDAVKANYLAEMGMEIAVNNVIKTIDAVILTYLNDLKDSKIEYIKSINEENLIEAQYNPISFDSYIKQFLIDELQVLNVIQNNPLEGYMHDHSYMVAVEYDDVEEIIIIKSIGTYDHARKQVIIEGKNPYAVYDGHDMYGLPKIKIYPLEIRSYYQAIITN
ncbi:hypothetical protein SAMN05446037_1001104 [Anaerovirgula multivorans]|uniref:Type 4 fimbrial biogenesis protein PilX N-terminal domain-containing protein n=1 Tax=Anaerovirgula multivorans TaxID=312168 RepID=A0A238ZT71_9FIRM|nr:hypothetical protein [Anaerovirgula multivorans]SNR86617.1 hypothetical protein SAMN05446037_1001104 [Anaerovirgula multivorans]